MAVKGENMTQSELINGLGLRDAEIAVRLHCAPHVVTRWRKMQVVPIHSFRLALCKLARVSPADVEWKKGEA